MTSFEYLATCAVCILAAFVLGYNLGYRQAKRDTVKAISDKLNQTFKL